MNKHTNVALTALIAALLTISAPVTASAATPTTGEACWTSPSGSETCEALPAESSWNGTAAETPTETQLPLAFGLSSPAPVSETVYNLTDPGEATNNLPVIRANDPTAAGIPFKVDVQPTTQAPEALNVKARVVGVHVEPLNPDNIRKNLFKRLNAPYEVENEQANAFFHISADTTRVDYLPEGSTASITDELPELTSETIDGQTKFNSTPVFFHLPSPTAVGYNAAGEVTQLFYTFTLTVVTEQTSTYEYAGDTYEATGSSASASAVSFTTTVNKGQGTIESISFPQEAQTPLEPSIVEEAEEVTPVPVEAPVTEEAGFNAWWVVVAGVVLLVVIVGGWVIVYRTRKSSEAEPDAAH